jgi:hypothetical protein
MRDNYMSERTLMSRDPNEPKPESLGQQRVNSKIDASLIEDPDLDPLVRAERILAQYDDIEALKADMQFLVEKRAEQAIRAREESRPPSE